MFTAMSSKGQKTKKTSAADLLETIKRKKAADSDVAKKDVSSQTDIVGQSQLDTILDKLDINTMHLTHMRERMDKNTIHIAHLNAKIDTIGSMRCGTSKKDAHVSIENIKLEPIGSLSDLKNVEKSCNDPTFIQSVVQSVGQIHGHRKYVGAGGTVCLQLVDYFFDRDFMLQCSWTGAGRTSSPGDKIEKIAFKQFKNTINLFHRSVQFSDPEFTLTECESFLHRCLKNAKQRLQDVSGMRKSVARKRKHGPIQENAAECKESDTVDEELPYDDDDDELVDIVDEVLPYDYDDQAEVEVEPSLKIEFL